MSDHTDIEALIAEWRKIAKAVRIAPAIPTPEMQHAYFDEVDRNIPRVQTDCTFGRYDNHRAAYPKMMAAAPEAPSSITALLDALERVKGERDAAAQYHAEATIGWERERGLCENAQARIRELEGAVSAERESCAQVVEKLPARVKEGGIFDLTAFIRRAAAAIRARSVLSTQTDLAKEA